MYFSLYTYCTLINGKNNSSIYNYSNGDIIEVEQEFVQALNVINDPCEDKYMNVYLELEQNGLGTFCENKPYNPTMQYSAKRVYKDLALSNNHIKVLQLQLDNTCDLDCWFCKNEKNYAIRQTGCYLWNAEEPHSKPDWVDIIRQGSLLGADTLFLTCNLSNNSYSLIKAIESAVLNNYKSVIIYSNGFNINQNIIEQVESFAYLCKISWVIQIVAHNNLLGLQLTGKNDYYTNVKRSLNLISEKAEKFSLSIICLIGDRNDEYLKDLVDIARDFSVIPQIGFIYPAPDHSYASEVYKNDLFNHKARLEKVDCFKFSSNSEYHNCFGKTFAVFFDGLTAPCIMMRRFIVDDIKKSRLSSIVSSSEFKKYTKLSKDNIEHCNECSFRYGCFDCRAIESNNEITSIRCNSIN